jgi:hypothetical protein
MGKSLKSLVSILIKAYDKVRVNEFIELGLVTY